MITSFKFIATHVKAGGANLDVLVDLGGGSHGARPVGVLVEGVLVEGRPNVAPRTRVLIAVPNATLCKTVILKH